MFYPQEMVEMELVVPAKDLVAVTKVLAGQGTFHQVDATYLSSDAQGGSASGWQEKASTLSGLERRLQVLIQTLGLREGNPPPADDHEAKVEPDAYAGQVENIEMLVKDVTDQLSAEEKKQELLQNFLRQLEPVAGVDLDISALRNPRYIFSILGVIPLANIERLQTSLSRIPHVFLNLSQDNQRAIVWLGGARNNADMLERAARSAYLNPLALPEDYRGTPAQIIGQVKQDSQASLARIEKLKADLAEIGKANKQEVISLLWGVRSSRMLTDAIVRFGKLHYTYVVVGWVPTFNLESLLHRLKVVSKDTIVETFATKRGSNDVPVALSDNKFLRSFQVLVTTYARPKYGEVDPTILIAITYPLLYGAMFGDVGHGLVLALFGWLIMSKRVKALNSLASLGGLITACGVVSVFFGFLYGSLFGLEDILTEFYHPLIQPGENIMDILLLAIGAGIILLTIGFLLGIYNAWMLKDWGRVLFDHNGIAGLVLYWGLILLLAGLYFGKPIAPAGLIYAMMGVGAFFVTFAEIFKHLVSGHRPLVEEGIGTYAIQAFFELFETFISFLSNSLSYVRVGAFAVAHGALTSVVYILAIGPTHTPESFALLGVGNWIGIIFGNLFIIGFEGLIVFIQTMRLEYYEFFSKFFAGGGQRFEPLKLQSASEE